MLLFHSFHLLGVWMKQFAALVQFNVVVADQSSHGIFCNICRPSPASNPLKLIKTEQPTMKKKKDESRKRKSALDEIMEVSIVNTRNKYKSFAFTLVSYPTKRSPLVSTMYQCSINI